MAALIPSASASGSGTMTLAGPSTNSNQIVNIPDATGTMMVSGNMPAFFAYLTADQSITTGTYTKIAYDAEVFDTNNNFASSRFTPTVAGYYQISGGFDSTDTTAAITRVVLTVYKNGSQFIHLTDFATGSAYAITGSALVYCNGSTDYIELYGLINGTGPKFTGLVGSIYYTWMSGAMVRGA